MSFRILKIFLTSGDIYMTKVAVKPYKTLKSNISKGVRDREGVSSEVR